MYINEENEPITGNLIALTGDKWRFLRNKLSPAFTSGKIKSMYSTISDKGRIFVEAIDQASRSGSVDMKDITNRFTIDVVSSAAFGIESSTLDHKNPELVSIFRKVFGDEGVGKLQQIMTAVFPNFSKRLNLRMFHKSVQEFFDDIVGGTIRYRETNKIERNDFLNMLIQLKNKGSIEGEISTENRKLTLDECIAQAFIFFFAGADTSSTTISFAMTALAQRLDIQEKLRDEINEIAAKTDGVITYDGLHEMTYLNQVMNGKLRRLCLVKKLNDVH